MGQVLHRNATTTAAAVERYNIVKMPEGAGSAAWHQPEDRCQVAEARLDHGSPDWAKLSEAHRSFRRAGGHHRGVPQAHALAARRLPCRPRFLN